MRPFHERMPAILEPADYAAWLSADTPKKALGTLLQTYPADLMEVARRTGRAERQRRRHR